MSAKKLVELMDKANGEESRPPAYGTLLSTT
jgi:hypothetical protein